MRNAAHKKVNDILLGKFLRSNVSSYVGYIIFVLAGQALQYFYIPRSATKFVGYLHKRTWWKSGPFLSPDHAEGITALIVGAWTVVAVCFLLRESIARYIVPQHTIHVRQEMYKALVERYEEEFQDIPTGNVITRLLSVSELYIYITEWVMQDLIPYSTGLLILIVYSWAVHRTVGTVVTLGVGTTALSIGLFFQLLIRASSRREQHLVTVSQEMNSSFSNLMNVYINNQIQAEVQHGKELNKEYGERWMLEMQIARNMNIAAMVTVLVTFGVVIAVLLKLVKTKKIRVIEAGALVIIYIALIGWMQSLFLALPQSLKRLGSLENAMPFLSEIFSKPASLRRKTNQIQHGKVVFENVSFKYPGTTDPVLDRFSLVVEPKSKVAIIGRSGSGKTTIMKLLLQLYTKYDGKILLDGVDITTVDINELRQAVNYINQRTLMHDVPIIRNLQYGNGASEKEVIDLLHKYDLMVVFDDIQGGIRASAGIDGNAMSLGMQKCVVIIRGVLRKGSKVVVFDEPIAGLDADTARKIMRLVADYTVGKTVIMITHNQEIQQYVDYAVRFKSS